MVLKVPNLNIHGKVSGSKPEKGAWPGEMTSDERQEEELQVLEAIYGEGAVVDLRKDDAWKIPRPPEFLLTVTPNHDSK